ncbi:hypothetical protein M2323_002727 [Rhodoblastus acidophilus]|nr:hypothetical protein [Rhodoblastus acidophilus]MCW2284919.1 hypothetical protein [Rhodoblastus acidophilus]MCW2333791.1 hypothetical protein [Rhodoblastus acidophilus]
MKTNSSDKLSELVQINLLYAQGELELRFSTSRRCFALANTSTLR